MLRWLIVLYSLFVFTPKIAAQACTGLGRTPDKAIPLCGFSTYTQDTVSLCDGSPMTSVCGTSSADNPYWFRFTCYSGGSFPFMITPFDLTEDYDWQVFDITTAASPFEVYYNTSLSVAMNWSGRTGVTGTTDIYMTPSAYCAGDVPKFSLEPTLVTGHKYLLLITHFVQAPSTKGFKLELKLGSSDIVDHTIPALKDARTYCDGSKVVVRFKTKILCSSIAANGSDFTLSPSNATIANGTGFNCSSDFESDSMVLSLSNPLPPGNYTLTLKKGDDFNTLLNSCQVAIPENQSLSFVAGALPPFGIDSVAVQGCAPDELNLYLTGNLNPLSIAFDGSDFAVTGPSPVSVIKADPVYNSGSPYSRLIKIKLSQPITVSGNYLLHVQQGFDGNTIVSECNQQISTVPVFPFVASDSIHAVFSYNIRLGCKQDTISYTVNNTIGITDYKWIFQNNGTSSLSSPKIIYTKLGQQLTKLTVSNGACSDTASATINLDNELKAVFEVTDILCPNEKAEIKETSVGNIGNWYWDFGNGNTSVLKDPPTQVYNTANVTRDVPIKLIVQANSGCKDTATQLVKVVNNCYIAVASAFTPNHDGLNDYLYPINAYKAIDLLFRVYNRFGQLIFESRNWQNKWDGQQKGQPAEPGAYVWILQYIDRDSGKKVEQKGTSVLLR
ncbi:MAG: gliding motility-associated C-terminal domain-containing protein [Ferruginibacter sp.]